MFVDVMIMQRVRISVVNVLSSCLVCFHLITFSEKRSERWISLFDLVELLSVDS